MIRKLFVTGLVLAAFAAVFLWWLSAPSMLADSAFDNLQDPDLARGQDLFWTGGCASCHSPADAKGDDKLVLSGGAALKSDFGDFYPPNISSDPNAGIGGWSLSEFANAMKKGVGPKGEHLYPSFPYTSYTRISMAGINDLWGFMQTLPASSNVAPPHALGFPFNVRRALGLWKFLYLKEGTVVKLNTSNEQLLRGQYLVEGPGHCGECHTPRTLIGGLKLDAWLSGAKNPDGKGIIPNITPLGSIKDWSATDIAYYLESGFTPEYDSAGGSMVDVQQNIARIPAEDREAISAYLKAIPGHANGY